MTQRETRRNASLDSGWDKLQRLLGMMLGKWPVALSEALHVYADAVDWPLSSDEVNALVATVMQRRAMQDWVGGVCREHRLLFTADAWTDSPPELVRSDVICERTGFVTGFDSASIDVRRLDLGWSADLPMPSVSSEQPVVYDIFPDYTELDDWYDRTEDQRIAGCDMAGDRREWADQQLVAVVRAHWPWDETDEHSWQGWSNN